MLSSMYILQKLWLSKYIVYTFCLYFLKWYCLTWRNNSLAHWISSKLKSKLYFGRDLLYLKNTLKVFQITYLGFQLTGFQLQCWLFLLQLFKLVFQVFKFLLKQLNVRYYKICSIKIIYFWQRNKLPNYTRITQPKICHSTQTSFLRPNNTVRLYFQIYNINMTVINVQGTC